MPGLFTFFLILILADGMKLLCQSGEIYFAGIISFDCLICHMTAQSEQFLGA